MAFNLFKKKTLDYPEEKASVLDNAPEGSAPGLEPLHEFNPDEEPDYTTEEDQNMPPAPSPAMQPPPPPKPSFNAGFRSPDELRPPAMPPQELRDMMSASMEAPRREQSRQAPQVTMHSPAPVVSKMTPGLEEGIFGAPRFKSNTPHIYIRVNKYKDVIEAVNELHKKILTAKEDLEDLHEINREESSKLKDAAEVVLKIEDLLRYLETTFTSPEL